MINPEEIIQQIIDAVRNNEDLQKQLMELIDKDPVTKEMLKRRIQQRQLNEQLNNKI